MVLDRCQLVNQFKTKKGACQLKQPAGTSGPNINSDYHTVMKKSMNGEQAGGQKGPRASPLLHCSLSVSLRRCLSFSFCVCIFRCPPPLLSALFSFCSKEGASGISQWWTLVPRSLLACTSYSHSPSCSLVPSVVLPQSLPRSHPHQPAARRPNAAVKGVKRRQREEKKRKWRRYFIWQHLHIFKWDGRI